MFGRLGDLVGRKYTFLVTILIMGLSTFLVGLLPGYDTIGIAAPIILIALRMLQGLALGGEYGGAATYVAEHAPHDRRGYYTSWIQTTATLGLFLSLIVILDRAGLRDEQGGFAAWGWRIPFLLSFVLLGISVWIRLSLQESPAFQRMKDEGKGSKAPLTEAFGQWRNAKIALLALFGLTAGQAVVWYSGQFYALFFLQNMLKVDAYVGQHHDRHGARCSAAASSSCSAALSDKIGRKPIIMAGLPDRGAHLLPAVQGDDLGCQSGAATRRSRSAQVTVIAAPADCKFQFNPVGTAKFTNSCDIAKALLARSSVNTTTSNAPGGTSAKVRIGDKELSSPTIRNSRDVGAAIPRRGYPGANNPTREDCDRPRQDSPTSPTVRTSTPEVTIMHPHHPGGLRDNGVRPDRRGAGRVVPDANPLHRHVAALSHRQWLVRRSSAGHLVRHGGADRQHLLRSLVSDRRRADDRRHRRTVRAGDLQAGHLQAVVPVPKSLRGGTGAQSAPVHVA